MTKVSYIPTTLRMCLCKNGQALDLLVITIMLVQRKLCSDLINPVLHIMHAKILKTKKKMRFDYIKIHEAITQPSTKNGQLKINETYKPTIFRSRRDGHDDKAAQSAVLSILSIL